MNTTAADSLLHWLMRTSLEASILILAVFGLRWALGTRLSPAWRIGLWMLVGAKLMLPAFVPAGFGLGALMAREAESTAITSQATPAQQPQTAAVVMRSVEQADGTSKTTWTVSSKVALVWLWLMGATAILLMAFARQRRFEALVRTRPRGTAPRMRALVASLAHRAGVRKDVGIVLMPAGTTPAMVGIHHPTLLLPQDWVARFDERSLRHVVAHELFHVKQGDLAWNWIALVVQSLHWFNPLVWLVVARFQADRELRCDAGALTLLAPTERLDYGHTLLRIQETFFAPPAVAGLAPCVRNHPALRQRILMIARPTTRQPWIQILLALTLGVLVCYSFTTAQAQEKEVPPKERTRETARSTPAPGSEKEQDGKKPAAREGDGGTKRTGMREGDGGTKKAGTGDSDGARKPGMKDGERRTGDRDGEKPRTAERDGEKPREGMRDGEKPRTGERDGERTSKAGPRDGVGAEASSSEETITLKLVKKGEAVVIGEEEISMNRLRGHLSKLLPEHPGAKVIIAAAADTPYKVVTGTMDAVRDNGSKNIEIQTE